MMPHFPNIFLLLTVHTVLTWISIYWFSRAGPTASFRIYYEKTHAPPVSSGRSPIPLGFSIFPGEIVLAPKP